MAAVVTISQKVLFKCSPRAVYEAFLDSKMHRTITGDEARISDKKGASFSVFSGWATGKNLDLVPKKRIVQSWHASDWPDGHKSTITLELSETKTGCMLMFTHENVPKKFAASIKKGWTEFYWKPMKRILES